MASRPRCGAADRPFPRPRAVAPRRFVITAAEGANLHLPDLKTRPQDFDPGTRDRFLAGSLIPATWVIQAQRFRAWYLARVLELFRDVDVILAPATPCTAPKLGQQVLEVDGEILPLRPMLGVYTQPISCIGLPVLAVPVPLPGGLPIGVQLIAAPGREDVLFRVADALERSGAVHSPRPNPN